MRDVVHCTQFTTLKKKYEEIIDFYFKWEGFESIFKLINLYFNNKF